MVTPLRVVLFLLVAVVVVALLLLLVVVAVVVVAVAGSGATEPVVGESEHHMQFVVFRRLHNVI